MKPDLNEVKALAASGDYRRIPVYRELLSDAFTPVEVMRTLRASSRHCYLLESAEDNKKWGRYSFLGYDPLLEITCTDGLLRIRGGEEDSIPKELSASLNFGSRTQNAIRTEHPGEAIRKVLEAYKSPVMKELPPFTGGLVGYFSYEYIQYAEKSLRNSSSNDSNASAQSGSQGADDRIQASAGNISENPTASQDFRDVDLMLFDKVIVFDNYRQKLILIAGVDTSDIENSYKAAGEALDEIERLLCSRARADFKPLHLKGELEPAFSKEQYCQMVEKAKYYIHEGDIFQVVLSNPMETEAVGSLFDTYRILRTTNPSPYMFYFSSDDIEVAGASPETLVKLDNGVLHTFPLAGTRPRGRDEAEDKALEMELLADEKELAEHNMLVDLGRNDLGKISELGSVNVEKYMAIERFSHVMHIGTTVAGQIRKDRDAVDAVDAILPAGTLSGAPKLRACEIIRELEGRKLGIYGGAIGYLDFTGNLDTCISIRLAYKKNGRVCVQSGAGIVADSVPENEFTECCNKARAVANALKEAEGGVK